MKVYDQQWGGEIRAVKVQQRQRTVFAKRQWLTAGYKKARRQLTAAHALACYRCFLPDLAGFTRLRCAGPAPDEFQYSISFPKP